MRIAMGGGAPPPLLHLDDPREAAARTIPEEQIEAAWAAEGKAMSVDETIAYVQKDEG